MTTPAQAPENNGLLLDEPLASLGRHRLPGASREHEVFTLPALAAAGAPLSAGGARSA